MKTYKNIKLIKILSVLGSLSVLIVGLGFGCGLGFQPVGLEATSSSSLGSGATAVSSGTNLPVDVTITANAKNASIPVFTNAYHNLLSTLRVPNPSNDTRDEFEIQQTNLSETGGTESINASFTFAMTILSAQVCQDKVDDERGLASAERDFFNAINLNAGMNDVSDADLQDVINRLARSLWQRDESAEELSTIIQAVRDSMDVNGVNNANETREAMLFTCTALAAAQSTYAMGL